MTDGVEEIRRAAAAGDTLEVAYLQIEHLEAGTPIVTAYLLIQALVPVLPNGFRSLVSERVVDTGIEAAMFAVLEEMDGLTTGKAAE